jgi:hypothetical protein
MIGLEIEPFINNITLQFWLSNVWDPIDIGLMVLLPFPFLVLDEICMWEWINYSHASIIVV